MASALKQILNSESSAKKNSKAILKKALSLESLLKIRYEDAFYSLWGRPGKEKTVAEVQAIVDEWGTNASKVFLVSSQTKDFLVQIDPDYAAPVKPYGVTINPDGTATISES